MYSCLRYFKSASVVICLGLFCCNDDAENSDQPIYIVADKLYSFKPSESQITRSIDLGVFPSFHSRSGNELFILSYPYRNRPFWSYVIDLNTFNIKRSKEYGQPSSEVSAMTVADKIYLYNNYSDKGTFISTINAENLQPVDTVYINIFMYGQDLLVTGNKVFLSLGSQIKVLDATTFQEIKTIDISSPVFAGDYSRFILDRDNNILIYNGGVRKLSPDDLTIKALRKHDVHIYASIKRPAYNANEEVLYILAENPEPGNEEYSVRKFNLVTLAEEDFIVDPDLFSFYVEFISYSAPNQLIVVGGRDSSGGVIKTFNTKGVLQKEYSLPAGAYGAY